MAVRSLKDAVITLTNGIETAVVLQLEGGDFSWTERTPVNTISDRGVLDHFRLGNEVPVEWSISFMFDGFAAGNSNSATISAYEFLTKTGGASAYASTTATTSDVWTFNMSILLSDPTSGSADDTVTFTTVTAEEVAFSEGEEFDTLTASGRVLQTAPVVS